MDSKNIVQKLKRPSAFNPLITQKVIDALQQRIEKEESSSRIYLAMSMWLNNEGYTGAAKLFLKYSKEELSHSDWAREHLLAYGVQPITPTLNMPSQSFSGLPEIIRMSFDHEIEITRQCIELGKIGLAEGDLVLHELSLKFLHEQREEMDKMQTFMDKLDAFGEDKLAIRLLDNEMGDLAN